MFFIIIYGIFTSIEGVEIPINSEPQAQRVLQIDPLQVSVPTPVYVHSNCFNSQGYLDQSHICVVPSIQKVNVHTASGDSNPLLDTLHLSSSVGLQQKIPSFNHYDHLPLNPYLALLLSHYGKYAPVYGQGRGIYGYNAANNYHNNKPFGSYKIYKDV